MRSVRFNEELEKQLQQAAKACGEPISEFIRDAVRVKCEKVLANRLDIRLADVIGSVSSGVKGVHSRKTGREFTRLLLEKHNRKKR